MEFLTGLIGKITGIDVLMIVGVITAFNAIIVASAKFLEIIKDKTSTDFDNKLHKYLNMASSLILKVLNVISARGK